MIVIVQQRQVKISRIFNRRRHWIRLGARISIILFLIVFMPYLAFTRGREAASGSSQLESEIDFAPARSGSSRALTGVNYTTSSRERKFIENFASNLSNASFCPEVPSNISNRPIDANVSLIIDATDLNGVDFGVDQSAGPVRTGGWWQPVGCVARHTTAIVVPYRDRESHLRVLLFRLHRVLRRQMISYRIFVVEQHGAALFNKGALFNAAFLIIRDYYGAYLSECIVFHDVDLIPEDERNMYTCPDRDLRAVRHMSPGVDKLQYALPYPELVGGVLALSPEIYARVNGYSNLYQGWGGEDDDMYERLAAEGILLLRPPAPIGRYIMLPHPDRPAALNRWRLLKLTKRRYKEEGLSQMALSQSYNIVSIIEQPAYTHITVLLNESSLTKSDSKLLWCFLFFWLGIFVCTALLPPYCLWIAASDRLDRVFGV